MPTLNLLIGRDKVSVFLFDVGRGDQGHGIISKGRHGQIVAKAADIFIEHAEVQGAVQEFVADVVAIHGLQK